MAKPIRNTPMLYGDDAAKFREEISKLPSPEDRRRERERIDASVNELMAMIAALKP